MKRSALTTLFSVFCLLSFSQSNNSPYTDLVWSDEFNGNGTINTSKWHHQTLLPNGNSWFNGELQHYTNRDENSYQSGGSLFISAINETFSDQGITKNYTSARLNSKFAFTYGRVVVKAKLPQGAGTWPAIWMLGKDITEPG
ncbi:MAG: beta-glucanase (GH16 family), partial [Flammeovirgaceae bacterium]